MAATDDRRETESGIELKPVYTSEDVAGVGLELPGEFPFTRGPYPTMYRGRPWTIRQYAGFGSAAETNARFRYLLERGQFVEGGLDHEPAPVDDQHAVDGLRDLRQHVTGNEHGPAFRCERAQEVAKPAHAFRVEAVGGLVEDQQLGLTEQRSGQPESLPHAERIALHAAAGGAGELDHSQHVVGTGVGDPGCTCVSESSSV
jgi:hypothetical protein